MPAVRALGLHGFTPWSQQQESEDQDAGERDVWAFEVVTCRGGGIVWAGRRDGVFDSAP